MLRTRLACSTEYKNAFQAAVMIAQKEGFRAFYGGLGPSLVGVIPYAGRATRRFSNTAAVRMVRRDYARAGSGQLWAGYPGASLDGGDARCTGEEGTRG